jgi:hypothetical protein
VLALDVLEHLPRSDTALALAEWYRVLRPGGLLHIQVPDLLGLMRMAQRNDNVDQHRQVLHLLFGTQAYTGDFHQTSFTDLNLIEHLRAAGYTDITLQGRDGWMFDARAVRPESGGVGDLAVSWGEGFHAEESKGSTRWRWAQPESELLLVNLDPADMAVTWHANVKAPVEGWMSCTGEGVSARLHLSRRAGPIELPFRLPTGGTRLHLSCAPAPHLPTKDPRVLACRFADIAFRAGACAPMADPSPGSDGPRKRPPSGVIGRARQSAREHLPLGVRRRIRHPLSRWSRP